MPANVYDNLRSKALGLSPADLGTLPQGEHPGVWGGLFEVGVDGGAVTFLCLADGTTSMYTSTGGGVIGGHAHESVRAANRAFLGALQAALPALTPATTFPVPRRGRNVFIAFTIDGKRRAEADDAALLKDGVINDAHPLAPLYRAGQGVVTAIRLTQETPIKDPWADLTAATFDGVRDRALRLTPEQVGFVPTRRDRRVWGAVIDIGLPGGRDVTVVSLMDGSCAYMVKGDGGTIVRGTARATVADASHDVLRAVDRVLTMLAPTTTTVTPAEGRLAVTALTFSGRLRLDDAFAVDGKPPRALAEPFAKAMRLLQTLKALAAKEQQKKPLA